MKYSNKYDLPPAVFKALCRDEYTKGDGDYSVTEILNPPQIVQLKRRYNDQLEEDVMDNVWSIFGRAAHSVLENHGASDELTEERLYVTVSDRKIGGQVDNYHSGIITDYKITSARTLVYGSRIHEWEQQLNLYAYIFRENGYEVNRLQIVAILRDWDKNKAKQDFKYPQTPIVMIPLNLWGIERQESFVHERVLLMKGSEGISDTDLAIGFRCMPDEMWAQPTRYAVMKEGSKKATRVLETAELATDYILNSCPDNWDKDGHSKDLYSVQTRQGNRTRCIDYCPVAKFCLQFKEFKDS